MNVFVRLHNKRENSIQLVPFLHLAVPFFFCFLFSADLQINGTLHPDIVSRLPNEVSNYELCYFLCSTGCDWVKEGTDAERGRREAKKGIEHRNIKNECEMRAKEERLMLKKYLKATRQYRVNVSLQMTLTSINFSLLLAIFP